MGEFSLTHLLLLGAILLIFFGPSRLPQLGQSLGKAIRGFKDSMNEIDGQVREVPPEQLSQKEKASSTTAQSEKASTENKS